MTEEGKKISFGFAKSIKKSTLVKQVPQEEKKVDYVECLDEKTIKVIREKEEEGSLVIPVIGAKDWLNRVINKTNVDIFGAKTVNENDTQTIKIKEEPKEIVNGDVISVSKNISNVSIKTEPPDENESNKSLTLEEQASKEIIEDLKSTGIKGEKRSDLILPLKEQQNSKGAKESTLDDYGNIPVSSFGYALIRGMGWEPDEEVGKNAKVAPDVVPKLRPKGLGLGADQIALQKQNVNSQKKEEELCIEKGSFIKIIAGKKLNAYGQIEGLDEYAGRLILKMALGGDTISVSEYMVQAVTKAEYLKNSKVLNVTKYEEYKNKEGTSENKSVSLESCDNSDNSNPDTHDRKQNRKEYNSGHTSKKSNKKSKNRRREMSDSGSDSKRRSKRRGSSSSSETRITKKAKKSKKHKEKDKEREQRPDKKSRHSESPQRKKSKKHRRSRSPRR